MVQRATLLLLLLLLAACEGYEYSLPAPGAESPTPTSTPPTLTIAVTGDDEYRPPTQDDEVGRLSSEAEAFEYGRDWGRRWRPDWGSLDPENPYSAAYISQTHRLEASIYSDVILEGLQAGLRTQQCGAGGEIHRGFDGPVNWSKRNEWFVWCDW